MSKSDNEVVPAVGGQHSPRSAVPVRTTIEREEGLLRLKQEPTRGTRMDDLGDRLMTVCGSPSGRWTNYLLTQLAVPNALSGEVTGEAFDAGVQFLNGIAPQNELEAALAAQMFMVHHATMSMAWKAMNAGNPEMIKVRHDQLNKLARTFAAQTEALSKLRTGGKQTVEVKYIDARNSQNVIADTINTGGGRPESSCQPQGPELIPSLATSSVVPLWSQEPGGQSVPGASDEGEETVPRPRGQKPRRAQG